MRALNQHLAKDGFRLRGTAMNRVDAFSDIVFGFALTLLVVSLEVPKTYAELHEVVLGFFPFALAFAFLILLWLEHYTFFRRYGMEDVGTICLNAVVLFLVLFYVYPIKFLFALTISRPGDPPPFRSPHEVVGLMLLYSLGFTAIYWAFAALYLRAWTQRAELDLSPAEQIITRLTLWRTCCSAVSAFSPRSPPCFFQPISSVSPACCFFSSASSSRAWEPPAENASRRSPPSLCHPSETLALSAAAKIRG